MSESMWRKIAAHLAVLPVLASAVVALPVDTALPAPKTRGGMALNEALVRRRSVREFADKPLSPGQVGQLCWAAQGITEPSRGLRTAPSAMAVYAVRLFVADNRGLHEYLPKGHLLRTLAEGDVASRARALCLNGPRAGSPPVVMVVCTDLSAMKARAGDRAERFALLEAGHATQNLLLQATALGLASVPVGGVDEARTADALGLPAGLGAAYLVPIGYATQK